MLRLQRATAHVVADAAASARRAVAAIHAVRAARRIPPLCATRRLLCCSARVAASNPAASSSSSASAAPSSSSQPPAAAPRATLLDGLACSERILDDIGLSVRALLSAGRASRPPGLAVLLATAARDSARYVERKSLQARRVGFESRTLRFDEQSVSTAQMLSAIAELNADESIDGILIQLPLPAQVDTPRVLAAVQPVKDVDCFHPANIGNLALFAARERREEKADPVTAATDGAVNTAAANGAATASSAAQNQNQASQVAYHPWAPRIAALSSRSSSASSAASAELVLLRDALALESAHTVFHVPCTPKACMSLLDSYAIPLAGRHVVVLGRSASVGLPLTLLLLNRCATVTNIDASTPESTARSLCATADVVVSAVGVAHMIDENWIKPGATVVDVGINFIPTIPARRAAAATNTAPTDAAAAPASASSSAPASQNPADSASGLRLVGDVDFARVVQKAGHLSPVPGGVGPMTVAMLMDNTLRSWLRWVARGERCKPGAAGKTEGGNASSTSGSAPGAGAPCAPMPSDPPLPMLFISGGPGAGKGTQANLLISRFGSQVVRGADGNDAPIPADSKHGLIELEDGRRYTLAHISVGALLRQQMQPASQSALKLPPSVREEIAQTLAKGGILAGHITVQLLRAEIQRLMEEHSAATDADAAAAQTSGSAHSSSSPSTLPATAAATVDSTSPQHRPPPQLAVVIDGFPRSSDNITEFERSFCALRHVLLLDVPAPVMQRRLALRGREDDREDIIERRMKGFEQTTMPTLRAFQQQVEAAKQAATNADPQAAIASPTPPLPPPRLSSSYSIVDGDDSIEAVYARVEPVLLQLLRSQQRK